MDLWETPPRPSTTSQADRQALAVALDGKLVWAEGFGFADIEQCVPVTPLTKFRIGSVSKPLTAAGVAVLVEDLPLRQKRRSNQQMV